MRFGWGWKSTQNNGEEAWTLESVGTHNQQLTPHLSSVPQSSNVWGSHLCLSSIIFSKQSMFPCSITHASWKSKPTLLPLNPTHHLHTGCEVRSFHGEGNSPWNAHHPWGFAKVSSCIIFYLLFTMTPWGRQGRYGPHFIEKNIKYKETRLTSGGTTIIYCIFRIFPSQQTSSASVAMALEYIFMEITPCW